MTVVTKPKAGEVEQRSAPEAGELRIQGNRLHGLIPVGVESRDLGGWTEVIEPGAMTGADLTDLVATLNHDASRLLGRFDNTLQVESRSDGLAWSVELGAGPTAADVKDAVERGDLNQSSWRMVVGRDRWDGTLRRIEEIRSLKDVAVVTTGAYPAEATRVELREHPEQTDPPAPGKQEDEVKDPERTPRPSGGLAVEDRTAADTPNVESRILDAIRSVPPGESRDLTHATAAEVTPDEVSTQLWQKLRPQSVVLASGVPVIATDRKKVTWPTLTGDVSVDFYDELEQIVKDDPDFDQFEVEPKAIKGLVRASAEDVEDSDPSVTQIVTDNLYTQMAYRFDGEAIIGGTSKGFPGMGKLAGQTLDMKEAAFEDYDPIIAAMGLLADAGVPGPYAVIMHSRVATSIDRLKEYTAGATNVPLARPEGLPPFYTSPQVGLKAGTGEKPDTSPVLVYAPKMLLVVRRLAAEVQIDRSMEFDHDAVFFKGRARAAMGTNYPEAIVQIKNVATPKITL